MKASAPLRMWGTADQHIFLTSAENHAVHTQCVGSIKDTEESCGYNLITKRELLIIQRAIQDNENLKNSKKNQPSKRKPMVELTRYKQEEERENKEREAKRKLAAQRKKIYQSSGNEKEEKEGNTGGKQKEKKLNFIKHNISKEDLKEAGDIRKEAQRRTKESGDRIQSKLDEDKCDGIPYIKLAEARLKTLYDHWLEVLTEEHKNEIEYLEARIKVIAIPKGERRIKTIEKFPVLIKQIGKQKRDGETRRKAKTRDIE
ncbi:hypothetical protein JTB14_031467 [Gonioctena quinquepunctata]|nr:hypothetical protein JTB14_031467 [Gonioctena quinquepunctata]